MKIEQGTLLVAPGGLARVVKPMRSGGGVDGYAVIAPTAVGTERARLPVFWPTERVVASVAALGRNVCPDASGDGGCPCGLLHLRPLDALRMLRRLTGGAQLVRCRDALAASGYNIEQAQERVPVKRAHERRES